MKPIKKRAKIKNRDRDRVQEIKVRIKKKDATRLGLRVDHDQIGDHVRDREGEINQGGPGRAQKEGRTKGVEVEQGVGAEVEIGVVVSTQGDQGLGLLQGINRIRKAGGDQG